MRLAWTRIPLSFYPASGDDLGKSLLDWKLSCTTSLPDGFLIVDLNLMVG
jgi:hypothetical protein